MTPAEAYMGAFACATFLVGYLLGFRTGRHSGEMRAYDKMRQQFGENRFTRDLPRRA